MSGSFKVKRIWPLTKQEVFEMKVLHRDICLPGKMKRLTRAEFLRQANKRKRRYWKYRNLRILSQLNFNRTLSFKGHL